MRSRKEILNDGKTTEMLSLEVLLDIRELLIKQAPKRKYTKKSKKEGV